MSTYPLLSSDSHIIQPSDLWTQRIDHAFTARAPRLVHKAEADQWGVDAKFDGDPMLWKIVDGKLYLNLNPDMQKKWERDIPGHMTKADTNWSVMQDKAPAELGATYGNRPPCRYGIRYTPHADIPKRCMLSCPSGSVTPEASRGYQASVQLLEENSFPRAFHASHLRI